MSLCSMHNSGACGLSNSKQQRNRALKALQSAAAVTHMPHLRTTVARTSQARLRYQVDNLYRHMKQERSVAEEQERTARAYMYTRMCMHMSART